MSPLRKEGLVMRPPPDVDAVVQARVKTTSTRPFLAAKSFDIPSLLNPQQNSTSRSPHTSLPPSFYNIRPSLHTSLKAPASNQAHSKLEKAVHQHSPHRKADFEPLSNRRIMSRSRSDSDSTIVIDGVKFFPGTPQLEVKFPPFECNRDLPSLDDETKFELDQYHRFYKVRPSNRPGDYCIGDFVKFIPYSSNKKSYNQDTGMDGVNVFQYVFTHPSTDEVWTVIWDYHTGLVRVTPFFKALNLTKTTPGRAVRTTPGLLDVTHAITGGALDGQGYWMPWSCARALCLTFCWPIRWALTPVFGANFAWECYAPTDDRYQNFLVPDEIIQAATLDQSTWRTVPDYSTRSSSVETVEVASKSPSPPPRPSKHRPARPAPVLDHSDSTGVDEEELLYRRTTRYATPGPSSRRSLPSTSRSATAHPPRTITPIWTPINRRTADEAQRPVKRRRVIETPPSQDTTSPSEDDEPSFADPNWKAFYEFGVKKGVWDSVTFHCYMQNISKEDFDEAQAAIAFEAVEGFESIPATRAVEAAKALKANEGHKVEEAARGLLSLSQGNRPHESMHRDTGTTFRGYTGKAMELFYEDQIFDHHTFPSTLECYIRK